MTDDQALGPSPSAEVVLFLDRKNTKTVRVPAVVRSHKEFAKSVRKIRAMLVDSLVPEGGNFIEAIYYLLGFVVGDAIKHLGSERRLTISLALQLTRKHPDNLQLGEYVMNCSRMLGIRGSRGLDGQPRKKVPNGFYSWNTAYSAAIGWLFTACLGLKWNQKTTKDPVRMDWILSVPRRYRMWFLRGLADSDGGVHFHERWVDMATSPNTSFVNALLRSFGLKTRVRIQGRYGYVSISARDAKRIQIFNPDLRTYRRELLEKLANARTYHRWPKWVEAKVSALIRQNLSSREIAEKVLEDGIFLKPRTINKKRQSPFRFESDGSWRGAISRPPSKESV